MGVLGRMHGRVLGRMSGRVHVSSVCAARPFVTMAWTGVVVREAWLGYLFLHDSNGRAARLVVVHNLVGTCPRFSVASHGLVAHGVNFMGMTEPCG